MMKMEMKLRLVVFVKGGDKMKITNEQIAKLKDSYENNKGDLRELRNYIRENGMTDDGLSDATESFEQGWNNAMEYVFLTLGVDFR